MRLLDRYLLRELLAPLGYCLSGFLVFWIFFDLFSELSDFQDLRMGPQEVAYFYFLKSAEILALILPIALLLSLLYTLTNHARHQELTAIRAAGISLFRLAGPYLALGFLLSLCLLALNELWLPKSSEAAKRLIELHANKNSSSEDPSPWEHNLNFRNAKHGRIWNIGAYNVQSAAMRNPQVTWQNAGQSRHTLIASAALWTNGVWTFYEVQELIYLPNIDFARNPAPERRAVLTVPEFSETPDQILSEIKIAPFLNSLKPVKDVQLSIAEILNYLRLHPDLGPKDRAILLTQLHGALARPWTCLVVVLIAIPFGAASGRRDVFVGVAASIFICFAYFILMRLGLTLGTAAYLPHWLAAWSPNAAFALAGIWLTRRVR